MAPAPEGLPGGFVDLADAYASADGTFVNIIGVVIDLMPPIIRNNSNNDSTVKFTLLDRKLFDRVSGSEGLAVRYFKRDPSQLPRVKKVGDVVLLRAIKMNTYSGQRGALSNVQTECTVFPSESIPGLSFAIAYQGKNRIEAHGIPRDVTRLSMAEQSYVMTLKNDMKEIIDVRSRKQDDQVQRQEQRREQLHEQEPPAKKRKSNGSFGAKFKLVEDLEPRGYADLCGEVVKRIGAPHGCDLYITDYTSHDLLRFYSPPESALSDERDGDTFGYSGGPSKAPWPGPFGQNTLKINVKPPHASAANQLLNEGDFVLLQNVKTRTTDVGPWLEGDMWPDHQAPERVKVKKLQFQDLQIPEVKAILQRKESYWRSRESTFAQKQRSEEQINSKSYKKKLKKKNKRQKEKRDTGDARASSGDEEDSGTNMPGVKLDKNPHVRCSYEEVHLSRVRDILDPGDLQHSNTSPDGRMYILPFINAKYRAKVRVVDYEPKALEDFAVQPLLEDEDSIDSISWQYDGTPKFEWYFSLLLEDATKGSMNNKDHNRMWVHVQHEQAQFLFGNDMDDPADLRVDSQLLAKLKEKMFVLWGNLEENDGQGLSNLPFECCIQEYGIEQDESDPAGEASPLGWQRMYSMFGVTIL